jgi:hypothetical protein
MSLDQKSKTKMRHRAEKKPNPIEPYLRLDGRFNTRIDQNFLLELPRFLRPHWHKLDLEKIYYEIHPDIKRDLDRISRTPVNVMMLAKEQRLRRMANNLGIKHKTIYDVGLWED